MHDFPTLKYPRLLGASWRPLPLSCTKVIHHFDWCLRRGDLSCSINIQVVCLSSPIWSYAGNVVKILRRLFPCCSGRINVGVKAYVDIKTSLLTKLLFWFFFFVLVNSCISSIDWPLTGTWCNMRYQFWNCKIIWLFQFKIGPIWVCVLKSPDINALEM